MAEKQTRSMSAYLHARGIDALPEEFPRMVQHALERLVRTFYQDDPSRDLTEAEVKALQRGGFDLTPKKRAAEDPLLQGVAEYAALLETSRTTEQAAKMLHVESSRIRQRLTSSPPSLYGIKVGSEWRIPAFQFDRQGLLPGLEAVVARLSNAVHPLAVSRWFTMPNPDLVAENVAGLSEEPLSPRDWLRLGLPPDLPAHLAADL